MNLTVSRHAVIRYQERVANLPDEAVIEGRSVVTVLPRGTFPGTLDARRGRMEASR